MNPNLEKRSSAHHCPLCEKMTTDILQEFNSEQAALHVSANKPAEERLMLQGHIENLWGNKNCSFLKCSNCGLSFASPFISGDSFFYTNVYDNPVGYSSWKWEFEITRENIKNTILENSDRELSLLEIGAGNGNFIKMLNDDCYSSLDILTTEYSESGRQEIEKLGIKCVKKNLWDLSDDTNDNVFDFICMFQVLEHMEGISKTFKSLSTLSNKGAYLFIAVPSDIHREYFEGLGYVEDVPPTHISRWSKEAFEYVGDKFGWSLVEHRREPNRLHTNVAKLLTFQFQDNLLIKKVNSVGNPTVRKILKLILYTPLVVSIIPKILPLRDKNLGVVQWVMFKKQ